MPTPRRSVGFFPSIAATRLGQLFWPEGLGSLVIGLGGGCALLKSLTIEQRTSVVGDSLGLIGVLLGVVFAAFALLVGLLSERYARLLDEAEGGVIVFLRPFIIAIGVQITTLFAAIGYRAAALDVDSRIEVGWFLFWAVLFSFALLDVMALGRDVALHGITRARQEKTNRTVRNLRDSG